MHFQKQSLHTWAPKTRGTPAPAASAPPPSHSYFIDKNASKLLRNRKPPTLKEKFEVLPRIFPFLAIIMGVLYVLYGGVATPSEASGVGAFLVFVMIAVVYKIYQPKKIWNIVKISMKESVMIMFIIAASYLWASD